MAQLSRPYQIGLVAVALLAAAWLLLIQGHSSSSSPPGSPAAVSTSSTPGSASSPSPASASSTAHPGTTSGPTAPGVSGLTRAVQKAQGAVATSEQNAKNLQRNSEAASSPTGTSTQPSTPATSSHSSSSGSHSSAAAAPAPSKTAKAVAPSTTTSKAASPTSTAKSTPAPSKSATAKASPGAATRTTVDQRQLAVEAQLHKGKIVLILFWDQKGTDDRLVHGAVQQVSHSGLNVAVEMATPHEVASFGSITRGVQVYGTPTLLIVNVKGHATTLTGLQDAYGIRQAITEARHA